MADGLRVILILETDPGDGERVADRIAKIDRVEESNEVLGHSTAWVRASVREHADVAPLVEEVARVDGVRHVEVLTELGVRPAMEAN